MPIEDASGVRAQLERSRRRVAASVVTLKNDWEMSTDWRTWVGQHPFAFLAGAFALGYALGRR